MSSGAVAAGNADTAAAAVAVLRAGGNACDAAIAAGFAAAVAEPGLTSLGGGGFLLAVPADGRPRLVDFFVDAPGRGRGDGREPPHFTPVTVRFSGADQVFYAGWGSVAVPGCLAGYLHAQRRLGRIPLADVVAPAQRLAARGVVLDPLQATVLSLLEGIVTLTAEGRRLFAPQGRLVQAGEVLRNEPLGTFLADVAAGRTKGFADPALAGPLQEAMTAGGGLVTSADLSTYAVVERDPLTLRYRGAQILTNPPPSFGGTIVANGLATLGREAPLDDTAASYQRLARVLVAMSQTRPAMPHATQGTTHVSVVDGEGNAAALTTTNGSCAGVFVPGTGVQLNNVMGEADLHPDGFHATPAGLRIGSMMAPTVLRTVDGTVVALGSGGSERIRSALACTITGLLDRGLSLDAAVRAPRLHWDRSALQVEPGLPEAALASLATTLPVRCWPARDLYFGGANAVARARDGGVRAAGDDRRGGVGVVVDLGDDRGSGSLPGPTRS